MTIEGRHFAPGEVVTITVNGHREAQFTADKHGRFTGSFTLVCYGTGPQTIRASGTDGDTVTIVVQVDSDSLHHGQHGSGGQHSTQGGSGGLSSTGVAIAGIGGVAILLLIGGGVLLFAGRRRRSST